MMIEREEHKKGNRRKFNSRVCVVCKHFVDDFVSELLDGMIRRIAPRASQSIKKLHIDFMSFGIASCEDFT